MLLDVGGWSFAPGIEGDGLWKNHISPEVLKVLSEGANIQFRRTSIVKEGYFANVCSRCGATQGDWFLFEELPEYLEQDNPEDFTLVLLKDEKLERRFKSAAEAEEYLNSRTKT